ncbi:MAG: hypothetical protein PHE47_07200 [Oscillospiraceae bacterium]|nr:hypothetical protein [Oscillospiraceae bacterium]
MGSVSEPKWSKLDNAAKIFPSTSSKKDPKVFRFSCELTEQVDGQVLQFALDRTMEKFPFYRSVLKKGLFWYYFEDSTRRPVVQPEVLPPCAPIYSADQKGLLFRVSFYARRINLEVYHAISDGTGALHFLRTLTYYYLLERHSADFLAGPPAFDYDASQSQKRDDSFSRYYEKKPKAYQSKAVKAYHQYGERWPDNRISIVEGRMSVQALLALSHRYHATLTEFLTALLILSIRQTMGLRETSRPVVITIPVNLRNYFPSDTARNFFSVINLGYDFSRQAPSLEEAVVFVRERFQAQLTADNLKKRIDELSALEHNLLTQLVPLILKDPVLRVADYLAERGITAAFSNVGKVAMPLEMAKYIDSFHVFTSTARLQACMCSFQDHFTISFSSPFVSTDVQRAFFRQLTAEGIAVEVMSNQEQFVL